MKITGLGGAAIFAGCTTEHGEGVQNFPNRTSQFLQPYSDYTKKHPYTSSVVTGMAGGGWVRVVADWLVRSRESTYNFGKWFKKWVPFHVGTTIAFDIERVPIYEALNRYIPEEKWGKAGAGFLRTSFFQTIYAYFWIWRQQVLMDWTDTGEAKFRRAVSKEYLIHSAKTWLGAEILLAPTEFVIQAFIPYPLRILGVMLLQRFPSQIWYTFQQIRHRDR